MNIHDEIAAINWELRTNRCRIIYITAKQVGTLANLINQGLEEKTHEHRIGVLRILVGSFMKDLTGYDIVSTKSLTSPVASYLIDQFMVPNVHPRRLSDYGREIIAEAERLI